MKPNGPQRTVPAALIEHYEREGWRTRHTLGAMVATWLADAPDATVDIWSKLAHGTAATLMSTKKPGS